MYRYNEENDNIITMDWLSSTVDTELKDINKVWPYLTIKGYIQDANYPNAATLEEVIEFMIQHNYSFVCASIADETGIKDIVFKFNQK